MDSTSPHAPPPATFQIVGGLFILLGSFGMVGMLTSAKLYFGPLESATGLTAEMLRSNASFASSMRWLYFPGVVMVLLQFCSGIGLLRASLFARKIALGCAVYGIAAGLYSTWLNITFTLPFTLEYTLQQVKNPAMLETTRNFTLISGYFGMTLGLLYPIVALILLNRPNVRHYCKTHSRC